MKSGDKLIQQLKAKKIVYAGTVEAHSEPAYWREYLEINKN